MKILILHLSDFVAIETCGKQEAFKVLKRLLNFSPTKIAHARLKYDTHVDYFLADSALECYPGHLLIDDCYVKALSLKEPTAQSWPLILRQLLEVGASYHIVTEWKAQDNTAARVWRETHNTRSAASRAARAADRRRHVPRLRGEVVLLGRRRRSVPAHGARAGPTRRNTRARLLRDPARRSAPSR